MASSEEQVVLSRDEALAILRALSAFSALLLGETIDDAHIHLPYFGLEGAPGDAVRMSSAVEQLIQGIRRDLDKIT